MDVSVQSMVINVYWLLAITMIIWNKTSLKNNRRLHDISSFGTLHNLYKHKVQVI